tara:strand:+ start:435 stop:680 length:246 start_codon:yes stop_codon:yes gene_type:complete
MKITESPKRLELNYQGANSLVEGDKLTNVSGKTMIEFKRVYTNHKLRQYVVFAVLDKNGDFDYSLTRTTSMFTNTYPIKVN